MTNAEYLTKLKKEFEETEAKYFYLIGDDETSQDCLNRSDERTMTEAYLFAQKYFEDQIKEIQNND